MGLVKGQTVKLQMGVSIIMMLVLTTGCTLLNYVLPNNLASPHEVTMTPEYTLVPEYNGVIMSSTRYIPFPFWKVADSITGQWLPTPDDVKAMEVGIPAYLESMGEDAFWGERVWEKLDAYRRQYGGVLIDDQPMIYTFFFRTNMDLDWQQQWIEVDDGGASFFGVLYNVSTGEFLDLSVNGIG